MNVNWCYKVEPMAGANENPPLVSYWLAGVGALFGWNESVLHAAMLVPALLAVAGVWLLARVLGAPPRLAGLALLAMPGFLVSSTTLMADVLAMALWTWAVLAWVRGLQRERMGWLAAGAVLAGLCLLTKYVGLAVVPLLFAYTVLKSRRLDPRILLLGVPLVLAFVYRAQMLARYGVDPFTAVGSYSLKVREAAKASALELPWLGLAYLGGACLPISRTRDPRAKPHLRSWSTEAAGGVFGSRGAGAFSTTWILRVRERSTGITWRCQREIGSYCLLPTAASSSLRPM